MEFAKWEALGNDYLIVDLARTAFRATPPNVQLLCDRHRGVGADGILVIDADAASGTGAVATLRIFNPDGSEAELSGNGARQAFLYLHREGRAPADRFSLLTQAGEINAEILGPDRARVQMGRAAVASGHFPEGAQDGKGTIAAGGELWAFQHVAIGNPQCAIRLADREALEGLDLSSAGPEIERAPIFPGRTNVSWWTETAPGQIRARIFERGVGETTASGTGACGAAVDYVLRGGPAEVAVEMDGGELTVTVSPELDVELAGEAHELFRGQLSGELAGQLGD